jgi:hypothetical protein
MMRIRLACFALLFSLPLYAQDAIPPEQMQGMFRAELKELYKPDSARRYADAHALLEKYFALRSAGERKEVVAQLVESGVDANILGRLARIRQSWGALEPGVYYVNEKAGPHAVMYFLGVPPSYDRAKATPLFVKLGGAHAFLTEPKPTAEVVADLYSQWIREEMKLHPDALVMMPLLNLDELYGPSYAGMNTVYQPLLHVGSKVNVDPRRVYLFGHGMAGHATWNLALHYPTYLAAIAPLSGGANAPFQRVRMPALRNVYAVVWHDANDDLLKPELSRELVRLMRINNYDVDYEETKNVGHAPTDAIVERVYSKLRSRSRELYPKEVIHASNRPDSLFNRNDWVQVYQMINPGADQRLRLAHGTGMLTVSAGSYKIAATLAGANRIEIKTENVASFRLYLNDQMVDLSRPVQVYVNRKERFNAVMKAHVDEMLKDQLFLGRGWRYYTGVIDIELLAPSTRPSTRPTTRGRIEVIRE